MSELPIDLTIRAVDQARRGLLDKEGYSEEELGRLHDHLIHLKAEGVDDVGMANEPLRMVQSRAHVIEEIIHATRMPPDMAQNLVLKNEPLTQEWSQLLEEIKKLEEKGIYIQALPEIKSLDDLRIQIAHAKEEARVAEEKAKQEALKKQNEKAQVNAADAQENRNDIMGPVKAVGLFVVAAVVLDKMTQLAKRAANKVWSFFKPAPTPSVSTALSQEDIEALPKVKAADALKHVSFDTIKGPVPEGARAFNLATDAPNLSGGTTRAGALTEANALGGLIEPAPRPKARSYNGLRDAATITVGETQPDAGKVSFLPQFDEGPKPVAPTALEPPHPTNAWWNKIRKKNADKTVMLMIQGETPED